MVAIARDRTLLAKTHDRAFAELFFDLADGHVDSFCAFFGEAVGIRHEGLRSASNARFYA